jgi:hypothetical protein
MLIQLLARNYKGKVAYNNKIFIPSSIININYFKGYLYEFGDRHKEHMDS